MSGKQCLKEGKSEKSEEVAIDSMLNNDQNNPDLSTNQTPSEAAASHEDSASNKQSPEKAKLESKDETPSEATTFNENSASNDENASKNYEVVMTEAESKDETTSDSVNIDQEGSTGSESSNPNSV
ncbi:uncharacterized protein A4U43_C08F17590 [Asparagus officinalis]|nr:uncharacterized protein A4U43_C08F17590 [Asparagus officinalis]